MIELTEEQQIARHYAACLDSCNLINAGKPENTPDEEWTATVERNKEHLRIMLAKQIWTTEDLTPLQQAAA
jgi:hypothetical protein